MDSPIDEIKKSIRKTSIGIVIGLILSILKKFISTLPNGMAWIVIIEIAPILAFIRDVDIIQNIPLPTAIGYFLTVFCLGSFFMPEWELGLNIILFIIYVINKIGKYI